MAADETLKKLHTALLDTIKGYEEASTDAEVPELKRIFVDMLELRQRHEDAIKSELIDEGETPGEDGSFMGSVHRSVIAARSAITGLDKKALSAFVSGEDHVFSAYDKALAAHTEKPEIVEMLDTQKAAVAERVEDMKRLAASAA